MFGTVCKECKKELIPATTGRKREYCSKACGNKYRRDTWNRLNPDKTFDRKERERQDKRSRMFYNSRWRAKKAGLEFNIEKSDISIPEYCPVLGTKLNQEIGIGSGYHPDSPSLDKIKPELGYIKGNVRVISARANLLKNDATVEELEKVLKDLRSL